MDKQTKRNQTFSKTANNIVKAIFVALDDKEIHTVNDLAQRAKIHWVTVSRYLNLISYIQQQPIIQSLNAKSGERLQQLVHIASLDQDAKSPKE